MKKAIAALSWFLFIVSSDVQSATVFYTLDHVVLADNTQMDGRFSWTYDEGDFENGVGEFLYLDIPWTLHDHTDLNVTFDIRSSIEITLEGSVHDDGVDIALVLSQPLTPTTSSPLSLGTGESKYEIGGNGFHDGLFKSGSISLWVAPEIQSIEFADNQLTVTFSGILQWSDDLGTWQDVDPQPASPYQFTPTTDNIFFRARSD